MFGQGMELHPVTVLLALALWYALWGMSGAILAIPITAVLRIIFKVRGREVLLPLSASRGGGVPYLVLPSRR